MLIIYLVTFTRRLLKPNEVFMHGYYFQFLFLQPIFAELFSIWLGLKRECLGTDAAGFVHKPDTLPTTSKHYNY